MIETMLKHLNYFRKQDKEIRKLIYRNAELIQVERQTTLFKAGEVGDFMYVIVKGLVQVQVERKEYGILKNMATLKDGDVFGELALIDINELTDKTGQKGAPKVMRRKRAADCITIENSWLLKCKQHVLQEVT